jgi:hypothetical protein
MTNCRPISVITATPPGFNPGMLASQVAARWFLDRHGLGSNATFFRLVPLTDRLAGMDAAARSACLRRCEDGIDYRLLEHAQLPFTGAIYCTCGNIWIPSAGFNEQPDVPQRSCFCSVELPRILSVGQCPSVQRFCITMRPT